MRTDPTIDRIRKIRHEISEECNHDTRKIVEYYMKYQQKYADRLMKKKHNSEEGLRLSREGKNLTSRSSGLPYRATAYLVVMLPPITNQYEE